MKNIYKRIRVFLLIKFKYSFIHVGRGFYCGKTLNIRPKTVHVGNFVYIGSYANLAVSQLIIEDFVMLGPRVGIVGGDHCYNKIGTPIIFSGRDIEKPVHIKKDVWIGYNSTILHGVTIGEGSIIAANSLIIKDVPPYSIVGGTPAKVLKKRFEKDEDAFLHSKIIGGDYHV